MADCTMTVYGCFGLRFGIYRIFDFVMMQEILVITSVAAAVLYLLKFIWKHNFSVKKGCEGCALHKMHHSPLKEK